MQSIVDMHKNIDKTSKNGSIDKQIFIIALPKWMGKRVCDHRIAIIVGLEERRRGEKKNQKRICSYI